MSDTLQPTDASWRDLVISQLKDTSSKLEDVQRDIRSVKDELHGFKVEYVKKTADLAANAVDKETLRDIDVLISWQRSFQDEIKERTKDLDTWKIDIDKRVNRHETLVKAVVIAFGIWEVLSKIVVPTITTP